MRFLIRVLLVCFLSFALSCSGGGSSGSRSGAQGANFGCNGTCANQNLTSADVDLILRQGVAGAKSLGVAATFAVLDRVGNVLALYQMPGAATTTTINGQIGAAGGLEGASVPATLAAISKAGTGAYLSSQGNAFSTRTASQIVQENFNPGEDRAPGGPLFGVQFSQLLCSDLTVLNSELSSGVSSGSKPRAGGSVGPRSMPLGLSADPGGIPLYKLGDAVGGIGVEVDGQYTLDRDISDFDDSIEERLALYASLGFEAPEEATGDHIFVAGRTLRYTDLTYGDLEPVSADAALDSSGLVSQPLFSDGTIKAGATFGSPESGIARTTRAGVSAAVLVDGSGAPRFPSRSGSSPAGIALSSAEVEAILDSALLTAERARGAIRTPLDSKAHVSIFVIDPTGLVLGMVRSNDAPVFGLDVALQKARSAAFFSSSDALAKLSAAGLGSYSSAVTSFLGYDPFTGTAFADRSIGNLSRPFFTDGVNGNQNGPLSLPFPGTAAGASWSPFNNGLQLDLSLASILQPLVSGSVPDSCASSGVFGSRLRNGLQIFAGAVPLYRSGTLIGAIGISGDGIDQDDLVAFYGASRRGLDFAGHTDIGDPVLGFNAPLEIRADNILGPFENTRLRYVNCPEAPFVGSNEQNVCDNL